METRTWTRSTGSMQCRRRLHPERRAALAAIAALWLGGCAGPLPWDRPSGLQVATAPAPSQTERYCAWFADADEDTLYVGLSPFWSALRAADGDPTADLYEPGPAWIGRFDLRREAWQEPLDVAAPGAEPRAGIWDVHVDRNGDAAALWFTSFFETSGRVDLREGTVAHFPEAGAGLNEIAPGPEGRVLVSRYGSPDGGRDGGELLTLDGDGRIARRWPMPAPLGWFVAPKTPAWSPNWGRLVASTDLLPEFEGGDTRHDAYSLEPVAADPAADPASGPAPAWQTYQEPELQFVAVGPGGREYRAEQHADGSLWLRRLRLQGEEPDEQHLLLDADFPERLDYLQDMKWSPDGRLVLTRWSGVVHVLEPRSGRLTRVELPRLEQGGLYYTAVLRGERICASYCAGVTVVCTDLPDAP